MNETYCAAAEVQYIDWEQVDLLVGDKDVLPEEIRGIYRDFTLEASHRIAEFRESLPLMDRVVLGKHAHYLKGAARSLGLVDFANRLGHIEHLHRVPSEPEWERITTQLERSLKLSLDCLTEKIPALAS